MVSKMGFEPTGTAFSGLRVYQLRHLDIVVGSAGVEPTSERGDRVQGYSLLPLPLGQLPKLNVVKDQIVEIGGERATRTLVSRGSTGLADQSGCLLPMLSEESYQ
jgi:hypothetical protein